MGWLDAIFPNAFIIAIKFRDKVFEKALRENAVPPIKGKITKGKLKWRGIRQMSQGNVYFLTQRGRVISPKVTLFGRVVES